MLPGGYMARPDEDGVNPGQRYIRVALVYDSATTAAGLRRLRSILSAADAGSSASARPARSEPQAAAPA